MRLKSCDSTIVDEGEPGPGLREGADEDAHSLAMIGIYQLLRGQQYAWRMLICRMDPWTLLALTTRNSRDDPKYLQRWSVFHGDRV